MTDEMRARLDAAYKENPEHYCWWGPPVGSIDAMKDAIKETQQTLINEYGNHRATVNFPKLMSIKID